MPNPPGKGHRYDGDLKTGHMHPPTVGTSAHGPDVTIDKPKFETKIEKIGTDITQKGRSDIYANVDKESGIVGKPESFRTDLPPADQMLDEKGELRPEIRAEADKASALANQPSQIREAARNEALHTTNSNDDKAPTAGKKDTY